MVLIYARFPLNCKMFLSCNRIVFYKGCLPLTVFQNRNTWNRSYNITYIALSFNAEENQMK